MPRSFAQLEQDQNVTSTEVEEVLRDYVKVGAAISARVVMALVDRTKPNGIQRNIMKELALKGACEQAERHHEKDAAQYQKVMEHLR